MIQQLRTSKNVFRIKEATGIENVGASPTNAGAAQGNQKLSVPEETVSGSGGTLYFDPDVTLKFENTKGEGVISSPDLILGHEFQHLSDYDKGTLDRSINPNSGVRRSEEKGIRTENRLRRELHAPGALRDDYGGKKIESPLE